MAAVQLPTDTNKLRDQLIVDQAPKAKTRTLIYDLAGLQGFVGRPFSSQHISLRQMYEMREDSVLAFAKLVSMVAVLNGKWSIECRDARKAAFLDAALRRIYGRLTLQFYMADDFGFQALVKEFGLMKPGWQFLNKEAAGGPKVEDVWNQDVDALVWEPFVPLRPEAVRPAWTDGGEFDGIKLSAAGFSLPGLTAVTEVVNGQDVQRQQVDVAHSLWVINHRDDSFGSIWGKSQFRYAFKYWQAYELALAILGRSVERKGDPVVVVRFPIGSSTRNGVEVPNDQIAMAIGKSARSGSVLVIPSEGHDDDEGGKGVPKWKVEYLNADEKFDRLESILSYLDTQKFRARMLPEQAVTEGRGGTSSRNVAEVMGTRSAEMQIAAQIEWDAIINQYMIPQLAEAHYPILSDAPARKVTKSFGDDEAALLKTLIESKANASSDSLPIDWLAVAELLEIPVFEGAELDKFNKAQEALAKRAESMPPPATPAPAAGGNAGVTRDTGFYYDARDLIELADDESLLASLPPTKHYEDQAIVSQVRLVRKLWKAALAEQYESFASYLESDVIDLSDLDLADKPTPKKIADKIMAGWKFSSDAYRETIKRTAQALGFVFSRAGTLELKRSNVSLDGWNPDEKELASWVKKNAASMVRKVESTTRTQLNAFLLSQVQEDRNAKQIAGEIRKHFSEFPSWRADLIGREEVRQFYNAATLFAGKAAKRRVQALDARLGPTDHVCEERNGRIFDIEDAFREDAKEHPRGTLAWRILPDGADLAIEYVNAEEAGDDAARIDREKSKIYLREGLSAVAEGEYLIQAVDWLERST